MLDTEYDDAQKQSEQNTLLEEQYAIVENLKQELQFCKIEQHNIRTELEILRNENQKINDIKESLNSIHLEECGNKDAHKKEIQNLQERIMLLETEKASALQLWHISLDTVSALEDQLKGLDGKGTKFYQEQANAIKESYSEAIKMLEEKLALARNNFIKHQTLYENSKERINSLTREKDEVLEKYKNLQTSAQDKGR
ncbi:hypothetical protein K0M31_017685 [Melipona bicolor]|uniref:Uncharacterized protein n=1 Tax=Melipona bicolor TaxID=60889 RepID=A0AA40KSQ3_9HYME|nr:hypothetical protein K0M31_017685 [Melipona bicolor]